MPERIVTKNRRAYHEYEILDRFEAGLVLQGTEVKAIREGRINLKDSFARFQEGELWLEHCHISPYSHAGRDSHDPLRPRKLLLHRRELDKLLGETLKSGQTIIPLAVYFKDGRVKVEIALARGKKIHDKRETARRKAIEREVEAELRRRQR